MGWGGPQTLGHLRDQRRAAGCRAMQVTHITQLLDHVGQELQDAVACHAKMLRAQTQADVPARDVTEDMLAELEAEVAA